MLTVNDEPIDDQAIQLEYDRLVRAYTARLPADELPRHAPAIRQQAREHAIGRRLLIQEARRRGLVVAPTVIAGDVDALRRACGTPERFQQHLAHLRLTPETLHDSIRAARQVEQLTLLLTADTLPPTDAELAAFYERHQRELSQTLRCPPDGLPPFETLKESLRAMLLEAMKNQKLTDFIQTLRRQAHIQDT